MVFIESREDFNNIPHGQYVGVVYRPEAKIGLNSSIFFAYSPVALERRKNSAGRPIRLAECLVPLHTVIAAKAIGCQSVEDIYRIQGGDIDEDLRHRFADKGSFGDFLGSGFFWDRDNKRAILNVYYSFKAGGQIMTPKMMKIFHPDVVKSLSFDDWDSSKHFTINPAFHLKNNINNDGLTEDDIGPLMVPINHVAGLVAQINFFAGAGNVSLLEPNIASSRFDWKPPPNEGFEITPDVMERYLSGYKRELRARIHPMVEFEKAPPRLTRKKSIYYPQP